MAQLRAERRIILLSAGIGVRRAETLSETHRLLREADWGALTEMLRNRRLLAALGPRIVEIAGDAGHADFIAAVDDARRITRHQGVSLQLVTMHLMEALSDAAIRCTPLKGPLLGEAIYGDPGRRPSNDIDLLVAPEELGAAVTVMRDLGYTSPNDHVGKDGLPLLHFALAHGRGQLPPVELHWRIHWYERRFAQERLLAPRGAPEGTWRAAPADELAALLLFYARDGFLGLRLASDLSAWWDTFGAELEPGALDQLIDAYPELGRVLPVAATVVERTVGVPARQVLADVSAMRLGGRVAVRLANPDPQRSEPQLHADMGLIDGLLAPSGDLAGFVKRQLLPPREVLAERAQRTGDHRGPSRLGHCARVLARYLLALVSLLRPASSTSRA